MPSAKHKIRLFDTPDGLTWKYVSINDLDRSVVLCPLKTFDIRLSHSDFLHSLGRITDQDKLQTYEKISGVRMTEIFSQSVFVNLIKVPNVCLTEASDVCEFGWGLLQRFDFEIDFTKDELELCIAGIANDFDNSKTLFGKITGYVNPDGLRIDSVEHEDWQMLEPGDVVLGIDEIEFRGQMRQTIHHLLVKDYGSGSKIRVLRNGKEFSIPLTTNTP